MWVSYTNTLNHKKFTIIHHESNNISKSRSYVKNHIINERAAHAIYSLSSLAHDSPTMTLESRSRQSLSEDQVYPSYKCGSIPPPAACRLSMTLSESHMVLADHLRRRCSAPYSWAEFLQGQRDCSPLV